MDLIKLLNVKKIVSIVAVFILPSTMVAADFSDNISGNIAVEGRLFTSDPAFSEQTNKGGLSLSISPEYKHRSEDGNSSFTFSPFYRWDSVDDERSHVDIRQLDYVLAKGDWEFQVGIGKTFWGVTESQHLVDIINQTDGVEGVTGEDKLGQPLIRLSSLSDNGSIDFFVLPYFRERAFVGEKSRFHFGVEVDRDSENKFESKDEKKHIDYALRISESLDEFDVGFSFFRGTSRDPLLLKQKAGSSTQTLYYRYPQIQQYGLDFQYTGESIIWKFEGIHRKPKSTVSGFKAYSAAVGGFEYTLPAITESGAELGLIAEYHNDSRGEATGVLFQNDLFLGARLALNDEASSDLLAGTIIDLDNSSKSLRVEASRRMGSGYKLNLEAQVFTDIDVNDPSQPFSKDDHILLEVQKFF